MNQEFMVQAVELALENVHSGRGGPFAAVIASGDRMIAAGANVVTSTNDPTAHAEMVAIRAACAALGSFRLDGCDIYATCEPCPMCLGAIYWARLRAVYFGCTAADAAAAGFDDASIYRQMVKPADQREIPFQSLLRDRALACFREWEAKPDRVNY